MRFLQTLLLASTVALSASAADLSPAQQAAAQKTYLLKCAKCHEMYEPSDYGEKSWKTWMEKMKKKSHLTSSDYDLLLSYTLDLRKGDNAAAPGKTVSTRREGNR